jgi:phage-related protein
VSYNLGTASGTIRITYDSSGVARAVAGVDSLEGKLKALENASTEIHVEDAEARLKLGQIQAEIADLSRKVADPRVEIDEGAAQAKIAALTTELAKLDGSTATVNVRADTKQATSNFLQFREGMFSVLRLGVALSPALVPVLAEITAGAGAMVGAFGAAGIGAAVFGGAAYLNLRQAAAATSELAKTQTKYNDALAAGDTKGQLKAFYEMQAILATLSPAERQFTSGLQNLQKQAIAASGAIRPQTFQIANTIIKALSNTIKALSPLLVPMANAFQMVATRIKDITASDEFQSFFAGIADGAAKITVALSGTFLNLFHAMAGVLRELLPYGVQFANMLVGWTKRLGDAANTTQFSDAIAKFFAYVRENGPAVADFLKLLVANFGGLISSAAPLGPVLLSVVNQLLKLTAIVLNSPAGPYVLGLVSMGLAAKSVIAPIQGVVDGISSVTDTIGAIQGNVEDFKKLGKGAQTAVTGIRNVWGKAKDAASALKSAAGATVTFVKNMAAVTRANAAAAFTAMKNGAASLATSMVSVAKSVGTKLISGLVSLAGTLYAGAAAAWAFIAPWLPWIALAVAIGAAIYLLYRNWNTVWNGIKTVFDAVVGFVIDHWKLLLLAIPVIGPLLTLIATQWNTIWNGIKAVFSAVVGALTTSLRFMVNTFQTVISTSLAVIQAVWNAVWTAIAAVGQAIWAGISAIVMFYFNLYKTIILTALAVIQAVWNAGLNAMRAVASAIWGAIQAVISGAISVVMGAVGRVTQIAGIFGNALAQAFGAVQRGIGSILGLFGNLWSDIVGIFAGAGSWLLDIGRQIVNGLISGIGSMAGAVKDALLGLLPGPLKSFANKLGIGSPSKVFAEYGTNIVQGLEVGINDQARSLLATMGDLASMTSSVPPTPIAPAAGGGTTNITFDFSNSTFGADSQEVKNAISDPDVLSKINSAARRGLRPV